MKSSNHIKLSPNCKIIEGAVNSILADLQRGVYWPLSKEQTAVLKSLKTENDLKKLNGINKALVNTLISHEVLLLLPKVVENLFTTINDVFYSSSKLNNCIIELSKFTFEYKEKISSELNDLGCKHIEIRVVDVISIKKLHVFLKLFEKTTVESIDLYIKYQSRLINYKLRNLQIKTKEVRWVVVYNSPFNNKEEQGSLLGNNFMLISKQNISPSDCGNISPIYFSINTSTYTESLKFNSCLNCKISISESGILKTCPSMLSSHGNIKFNSLNEAILKKEYIQLTRISKDKIKVCQDCEFRYICSDCRAFLSNPNDIYSKPLKCGYNPYKGVWEDWRKIPANQEAIKYYRL